MSLSGIVNTHTIAAHLIVHHGTEEQKQRWLPRLATGELRGCLSLSEPDAGQRHAQHLVPGGARRRRVRRSTARRCGSRTASGPASSRSRRAPTRASRASSSRRSPGPTFGGITVSKNIGKLGYKGIETVEMVVRRPPRPGRRAARRRRAAASATSSARSRSAASTSRRAPSAWRAPRSTPRSRTRRSARTIGKPIAEHQAIQLKLADMATKLEAARLLTAQRGRAQAGGRARRRRGRAWRSCSRARPRSRSRPRRCASTAASATRPSCPVERYYRDAPLMIIGEGTNEIQRLVIARGLLARSARQ